MSRFMRVAIPVLAIALLGVAAVLAVLTFSRPTEPVGAAPSTVPSSSPADSFPASAAPSMDPSPTLAVSPPPSPTEPAPAGPFDVRWTAVPGMADRASVWSVAFIGGRWIAGGQVADTAAAWYSDDDGATWTAAVVETTQTTSDYSMFIEVVPFGDAIVAIGQWGAQQSDQTAWALWQSSDGGATWVEVERTGQRFALQAVTVHGSTLVGLGGQYAGTTPFDSFVATSSDAVRWTLVEPDAMTNARIAAVVSTGERLVAAGTFWANPDCRSGPCPDERPGVWLSDDGGATWRTVEVGHFGGAEQGTITGLVTGSDGLLVAVGSSYTEDGTEIAAVPTAWISSDAGESWQVENIGAAGTAVAIAAAERGFVAVGLDELYGEGAPVAWTSEDGILWSETIATGEAEAPIAAGGNGMTVVVGTRCGVLNVCRPALTVGTIVER